MNAPVMIDEARLIVGECPLWDEQKGILYTIDIRGKCIRRRDLASNHWEQVCYPQEIGCIALTREGELLAAMADGVYLAHGDGSLTPVCVPKALKGRRFNDGKVGPDGRFYVGTTDVDHQGAFYRLDRDGTLTELFDGVGCSNGLAWSGDHQTLYYCDSPKRVLEAFDFNELDGSLTNRRVVMPIPCETGELDGMTIDAEDKLWVAIWGGHQACRIDPIQKRVLQTVAFPISRVSCCAFAGENLQTLIVTTSAYQADDEPEAGRTYALCTDVPGVPLWRYERQTPCSTLLKTSI